MDTLLSGGWFDRALAVDWLATFALHSTLALGAAWLLTVLLRERAVALQELVLRVSMWAALVSATVQVALRGRWGSPLVLLEPAPDVVAADPTATELAAPAVDVAGLAASAGALPWSDWALLLAAASAAAGCAWLFRVHRRLRRVLRARSPETDPRVLAAAAHVARALGLRQSPHVSRSAAVATPIAFGTVRPEICLPMRAGELGDDSLRAMLAHEVAHLRSADPAWMWGAICLQALFPWQVLFAVVRRRWARRIELRCDAIAASAATPTAVARCLLDVAGWLRPAPQRGVAALGMAARPSALRERVAAALHGQPFRPLRRGAAPVVAGLALAALCAAAPAVATARAEPGAGPDGAWSTAADAPAAVGSQRTLLAALRTEHDALVAEAASARRELGGVAADGELERLLQHIERRLQQLARMRQRVEAALARGPAQPIPSESTVSR